MTNTPHPWQRHGLIASKQHVHLHHCPMTVLLQLHTTSPQCTGHGDMCDVRPAHTAQAMATWVMRATGPEPSSHTGTFTMRMSSSWQVGTSEIRPTLWPQDHIASFQSPLSCHICFVLTPLQGRWGTAWNHRACNSSLISCFYA